MGSQTDMVQLTQTGAIDFCVASNAILETFSKNYEISICPICSPAPRSPQGHGRSERDGAGFDSTKKAGFTAVTWLDAGTRNFYTINKPIEKPGGWKGPKIRVQQSPTSIEMIGCLAVPPPMGLSDVHTAPSPGSSTGGEHEMSPDR